MHRYLHSWLEEAYPDFSSLYLPEVSSSQATSSGLQTAKGYLNYVTSTFGSPAVTGAQFPPFFAAIHEGICALSKDEKVSPRSTHSSSSSLCD